MDVAGTLISPGFDKKLKSRHGMYKTRHGFANYKDILRERFQRRIKAQRGALFEKMRLTQSEVSSEKNKNDFLPFAEEMETDEVAHISSPDSPSALLTEYERLEEEGMALYSSEWSDQVICPICSRGALVQHDSSISCSKCTFIVPVIDLVTELSARLTAAVEYHEMRCCSLPDFIHLKDSLLLICDDCECWYQVV